MNGTETPFEQLINEDRKQSANGNRIVGGPFNPESVIKALPSFSLIAKHNASVSPYKASGENTIMGAIIKRFPLLLATIISFLLSNLSRSGVEGCYANSSKIADPLVIKIVTITFFLYKCNEMFYYTNPLYNQINI